MPSHTYQVDIDKDLKTPLKVRAALENTTVKAWVSELIRQALATECSAHEPGDKAA